MQYTQGADEYEEGDDYFDLYVTGTQVEEEPYLQEEEKDDSNQVGNQNAPRFQDSPSNQQTEVAESEEGVETSKLDELLQEDNSDSDDNQSKNSETSSKEDVDIYLNGDDEENMEEPGPEYMSLNISQTQNPNSTLPSPIKVKPFVKLSVDNVNYEEDNGLKKSVSFYEEDSLVEEDASVDNDDMEVVVSQSQLHDEIDEHHGSSSSNSKSLNAEVDENESGDEHVDEFDVQISQTQAPSPTNKGITRIDGVENGEDNSADQNNGSDDEDNFEVQISQTQLPNNKEEDKSKDKSPENFSVYDVSQGLVPPPSSTSRSPNFVKSPVPSDRKLEESPTQVDTYRSPELVKSQKQQQDGKLSAVKDVGLVASSSNFLSSQSMRFEESSVEWINSKRVVNEDSKPLHYSLESSTSIAKQLSRKAELEANLMDIDLSLSQSLDSNAEDLAKLQEEYAHKLQELLAMKKAIQSAAKGKSIEALKSPQPVTNDQEDNSVALARLGTLECADILVNINQSGQIKGPVNSPPDSANTNSGPSRKFNTSFALQSASKRTPIETKNEVNEANSSGPGSGKFRRRYASSAEHASPGNQKSAVVDLSAAENLFDFPVAVDEEVESPKKETAKPTPQGTVAKAGMKEDDEEFDENEGRVNQKNSSNDSRAPSSNRLNPKDDFKAIKSLPEQDDAFIKDIPVAFLEYGLPQKWTKLWAELEAVGWYWTKGKGLISFFYIRPNAKGCKPYVMNKDYFPSGEEVVKYLKRYLYEENELYKITAAKATAASSSSSSMKPSNSNDAEDNGKKEKKRLIKPNKKYDAEEDLGWNDDVEAHLEPAKTLKGKQAIEESAKQNLLAKRTITSGHQSTEGQSKSSTNSPMTTTAMNESGAMDIRNIPWKDLWKILRGLGWSWDFGPSHLNYYYRPGFDCKKDKEAILGEHKFENDESIRRYIRKQIKAGHANDWPMFYVSNLHRNDSIQESQLADAHLKDPSWMLITHRKRRESHPVSSTANHDPNNADYFEEQDGDDADEEESSRDFKAHSAKARRQSAPSVLATNSNKTLSKSNTNNKRKAYDYEDNHSEEHMTQAQGYSPFQNKVSLSRRPTAVSSSSYVNPAPSKKPTPAVLPSSPVVSRYSNDNSLMQIVQSTMKQRKDIATSSEARKSESTHSSTKIMPGGGHLFRGWNLIFSGIEEKLRTKLENEVKKQGGKVLEEVPKDIGILDEKYVLISQPKDFRKVKYLFALLIGIKIIHSQWLVDSLESGTLLPEYSYQLPATYSALHSCYIFKSEAHLVPLRKFISEDQQHFLSNLQVLNLTGMKIWDDVLLASGALIVNRDEYHLQAILRNQALANDTSFADLILFDPVVYTRSYILSYGNSKYAANQSRNLSRTGKEKKSIPTISELEIRVLKQFSDFQARTDRKYRGPIIASIDWLTHVIALKQFIDVKTLDLFSLPTDPVKYPTAFKADFEFDPTLKDSSGERYSKYDLVYFVHNLPSVASPGNNNNAAVAAEPPSIGKITGFSRRNEDCAPMVRIQTVDIEQEVRQLRNSTTSGDKSKIFTVHQLTPVLNAITETPVEILVSTQQLAGKVVLLHRTAYSEVIGYSKNVTLQSNTRNSEPANSTARNQDKVYSSSLLLEEHWPIIPWNETSHPENEENWSERSDDDESRSHPQKKRKISMRSSQDF